MLFELEVYYWNLRHVLTYLALNTLVQPRYGFVHGS
jgi:hypothetical protein